MSSGERLNIVAVLEKRLSADERRTLVGRLLLLAGPHVGEPHTLAIHQVNTPEFREMPWEEKAGQLPIPDVIPPNVFVHVYTQDANGGSGVLTVEQTAWVSTFALSLPLRSIDGIPLEEIETLIAQVYTATAGLGRATVAAGPELEVDADAGSLENVTRKLLADTSLLTFVTGSEELFPKRHPSLEYVDSQPGSVAFRHKFAKERLRPR